MAPFWPWALFTNLPILLKASKQDFSSFLPSLWWSLFFSSPTRNISKLPRQSLFLKPEAIFTVGFSMVGEQKNTAPEFSLKYYVGQSGSWTEHSFAAHKSTEQLRGTKPQKCSAREGITSLLLDNLLRAGYVKLRDELSVSWPAASLGSPWATPTWHTKSSCRIQQHAAGQCLSAGLPSPVGPAICSLGLATASIL